MVYHILNGDALTGRFENTGLAGKIIVTREGLVDGNLDGETLQEFFHTRADYLVRSHGEDINKYYDLVANEFDKLLNAPPGSEFNLWFGYDLFCRANMWFILSLVYEMKLQKQVFVVYPSYLSAADRWKDFGNAAPHDLLDCFRARIPCSDEDIRFGRDLWMAFKKNDLEELKRLSVKETAVFPYLGEVCEAHIDRFPRQADKGRPEKVIEAIMADSPPDFFTVFREFSRREGIYGFGDVQVKKLYDKVLQNH